MESKRENLTDHGHRRRRWRRKYPLSNSGNLGSSQKALSVNDATSVSSAGGDSKSLPGLSLDQLREALRTLDPDPVQTTLSSLEDVFDVKSDLRLSSNVKATVESKSIVTRIDQLVRKEEDGLHTVYRDVMAKPLPGFSADVEPRLVPNGIVQNFCYYLDKAYEVAETIGTTQAELTKSVMHWLADVMPLAHYALGAFVRYPQVVAGTIFRKTQRALSEYLSGSSSGSALGIFRDYLTKFNSQRFEFIPNDRVDETINPCLDTRFSNVAVNFPRDMVYLRVCSGKLITHGILHYEEDICYYPYLVNALIQKFHNNLLAFADGYQSFVLNFLNLVSVPSDPRTGNVLKNSEILSYLYLVFMESASTLVIPRNLNFIGPGHSTVVSDISIPK